MKALRNAYTQGFKDGKVNQWLIDKYYPFPKTEAARTATLSDGTIVTAQTTAGWKPPFAKALTPEDAAKLLDLWISPTEIKSVEDNT